ncbi:MAG: Abi family protein [Opitutaceae bacterium]|jgi:abortive infection bacteriophage resistance protein|nr:Abi family protein [Opitutaceae bacterium]
MSDYTKKPLTLDQQAGQLIARGLIVTDKNTLIKRLGVVNYYRLSGYLYPFRIRDAAGDLAENYRAGTTLEIVWQRYNFDRRLRMVLLDAIERVEVAVRTRLVYHFVRTHGPFGHLDERNLPNFSGTEYQKWRAKLQEEKKRAREIFVSHFDMQYGDRHADLPLWMACELMTCGTVQQFINGVDGNIVKKTAADFGFPDQQLLSWTKAVFALRNTCAHHARVWNRAFGVKPSIPGENKNPRWHVKPGFAGDRVGLLLAVCHHWLGKITPTTRWRSRLFALFDEYPEIPLADMGIPPDWRSHPLWK